MDAMHENSRILSCLGRVNVGVLATLEKKLGTMRQRVMYYGFDENFSCYLLSAKGSPKTNHALASIDVSFMVFGLEDPYDKSWEVEIDGNSELLTKAVDISFALEKLKGRNPFADIAIESGISAQFDLIRINPTIVRFRVYGEILKGMPPTIVVF